MTRGKRFLSEADIGALTGLDPVGVRALLAREPLLTCSTVSGQAVVPVAAWRRWLLDVNRAAIGNLPTEQD